jgi:hypothetical protein
MDFIDSFPDSALGKRRSDDMVYAQSATLLPARAFHRLGPKLNIPQTYVSPAVQVVGCG